MLSKKQFISEYLTNEYNMNMKKKYDQQLKQCYKNLDNYLDGYYNKDILNRKDDSYLGTLCQVENTYKMNNGSDVVKKLDEYLKLNKDKVKDNNITFNMINGPNVTICFDFVNHEN